MKYQKLNINSTPLNRWQIFKWKHFILDESKFYQEDKICKGTLSIRAKDNFELINQIPLEYHYVSRFIDRIFTANKDKQQITEINLESLNNKQTKSSLLPEYFWDKAICYHNLKNHTYEIFDAENNLMNSLKIEYPIGFICCDQGVILWNNEQKQNNWIECREPITNNLKWRVNLEWKFVRIELFQNRIVIEYNSFDKVRTDKGFEGERDWYNPERFTIGYDTSNGNEVWKHCFAFSQIDKEQGVVLAGNKSIYEVDLQSGELINHVKINPEYELGYYPHFADSTSYYYTLHNGKFGKIDKQSGSIKWEFEFIDNLGAKRKISDWQLLSNGNLIIRTVPNHKNGDITCILNPSENKFYSKIDR